MVTFDICKGNPGALTFVMLAYEYNPYRAEAAFRRMQNNGITGDKLYMLWNDCCDRDVEQALVNMECMSMEEIVSHINYEGGRASPFRRKKICGGSARRIRARWAVSRSTRSSASQEIHICSKKTFSPGARCGKRKPGEKSSRFCCAWGHFLLHIVPQCTDKVKIAASTQDAERRAATPPGGGGRACNGYYPSCEKHRGRTRRRCKGVHG